MKEKLKVEELIDEMYPSISEGKRTQILSRAIVRFGARKVLTEYIKRTQPAPLRPLRELAEDKEMCEKIARLCGHEIREVINKGDRIYFNLHDCEDLTIFFNGDIGSSMVYTPIIQICQLISSRYKIGE